ncbi:MAG TPA: hypothetical protein ENJ35_01610 [Gammaproteobacteria bacterium]|nr:hypothetical protein [Gammaproteobacteria bacterium]
MKLTHPARLQYPFLLALVLGLAGCADDTSGTSEPTYTSLWNSTFSSCGVNCHAPGVSDGTENGPDLRTKAGFYANLVGKNVNNDYPAWASFKSGNCNNIDFITPGDAARSTVVTSLVESFSINQTSCTSSFNLHAVNKITISDKQTIDALVSWVNAGAPNN